LREEGGLPRGKIQGTKGRGRMSHQMGKKKKKKRKRGGEGEQAIQSGQKRKKKRGG